MVKQILSDKRKIYQCEECGTKYLDENMAKKCQAYCAKYHACNIEYLRQAIKEVQ